MKARLLIRSVIGLGLLFPSLSSAVDDLCRGPVQDTSAHPMQPVARPAKRAAYIDPAFGTTIRRITQVAASGGNAIIKPMYFTMQAFNADDSLLLLWQRSRGHLLFDGQNYNFIRQLPIAPTDLEQVLWDPIDPDLLYYPTNYNAVPNLIVYRVSTNTVNVLRNFQGTPTNCPVDWGKLLSLGSDPQYMSYGPEKTVGLKCGDTKFLYSISQNRVLAVGSVALDTAPIVAPSGNLVYYEGHVFDTAFRYLRTLSMATTHEHASIGRSTTGDTYNAVAFDDAVPGTLVSQLHALVAGQLSDARAERAVNRHVEIAVVRPSLAPRERARRGVGSSRGGADAAGRPARMQRA